MCLFICASHRVGLCFDGITGFFSFEILMTFLFMEDNLIRTMYHMDVLKKIDENIYVSIHDALTVISNRVKFKLETTRF